MDKIIRYVHSLFIAQIYEKFSKVIYIRDFLYYNIQKEKIMIDIHAHIYYDDLAKNIPALLARAKDAGVEKIVCVGSSLSTSKKALDLAKKYENVYAAIGVHPDDAKDFDDQTFAWLKENAAHPKVVAIGEIGLDFHYEGFDKLLQKKVFVRQLELAHKVGLPIQIHSRDCTGFMMDTLRENRHLLSNGGIVHCFSGSPETLREVIDLGLSISLGGIVTFKNARETLDVAQEVPLENLLLETDCPYLTPHPHRGETNEPKFVALVAEKIAMIKGVSFDDLDRITTQNAHRIFPKLLK